MIPRTIPSVLFSSWKLHSICCTLILLCNIPLLWPTLLPESMQWLTDPGYGNSSAPIGSVIACIFLFSAALGIISVLYWLFRLKYTRSLLNLVAWFLQWLAVVALWILMAISADVPSLSAPKSRAPIQTSASVYDPSDNLRGPGSLVIHLQLPTHDDTTHLASAPNLTELESKHCELFGEFLSEVPRWSHRPQSSAFYTEPGHLVLCLPLTRGYLSVVHACFNYLEEGTKLPSGFKLVNLGDPMPQPATPSAPLPDLAINLGNKHFLLLAARGMTNNKEAAMAINAAIRAIDIRMQRLAENPTKKTIQTELESARRHRGSTPELLVCEPPTQPGVYQAEIYCNPGEEGELLTLVKDQRTGDILRIFNFPARYSSDPYQIFRHDIPGDLRRNVNPFSSLNIQGRLPNNNTLFTIREGTAHQFFEVAFEVWFIPQKATSDSKLLLRRSYKVQTYAASEHPDTDHQPSSQEAQKEEIKQKLTGDDLLPLIVTNPFSAIAGVRYITKAQEILSTHSGKTTAAAGEPQQAAAKKEPDSPPPGEHIPAAPSADADHNHPSPSSQHAETAPETAEDQPRSSQVSINTATGVRET